MGSKAVTRAQLTSWGVLKLGWPFRTTPGWSKEARAYSPSLAIHWMQMPWKEGVALGAANLCSLGQFLEIAGTATCSYGNKHSRTI